MAAIFQMDVAPSPRIVKVTGDSSYATGGYAVPGGSGTPGIADASVAPVGLNDGAARIALYDAANKKVKFITAATGAEVANASDQSGTTVKLLLYP
jgi:hypothetical protein